MTDAHDGARLLVVDDEENNRDLLERRLRRDGYTVDTAVDGPSALQRLERERYDMLLLDVMMPGMSGLEVLKRLRKTHSQAELPVILVTAETNAEIPGLDFGANDHVSKPIDFHRLRARIRTHLKTRAQTSQSESGPIKAPAADSIDDLINSGTGATGVPGPDALLGQEIAGKYRLDSIIGRGGFGAVYRAYHRTLDADVAVKVMRFDLRTSKMEVARFKREAASAFRLRHPNAVHVFDLDVTEGGLPYLVMELLLGDNLREIHKRGLIPVPRVVELLLPVCDVLAEAHASSIVHRDIKPGNIFLHNEQDREVVKVVDFGIAKIMEENANEESDDATALTGMGQLLGTPAYMAPERWLHNPFDGRTDVYSLAVTLFELVTGQLPFGTDGGLLALGRMHAEAPPPPITDALPAAPAELDEILRAAMAKSADDRPSVVELGRLLARAVEIEIDPQLRNLL